MGELDRFGPPAQNDNQQLCGVDLSNEDNLHDKNPGDHNLSRMQDEVRRCEEDAFLSGVLKESPEGSKKMVVY